MWNEPGVPARRFRFSPIPSLLLKLVLTALSREEADSLLGGSFLWKMPCIYSHFHVLYSVCHLWVANDRTFDPLLLRPRLQSLRCKAEAAMAFAKSHSWKGSKGEGNGYKSSWLSYQAGFKEKEGGEGRRGCFVQRFLSRGSAVDRVSEVIHCIIVPICHLN